MRTLAALFALALTGCSAIYPPPVSAQVKPAQGGTGYENTGAANTVLIGRGEHFQECEIPDCTGDPSQALHFDPETFCFTCEVTDGIARPEVTTDRGIVTWDGTDGSGVRENTPSIESTGNLNMKRLGISAVSDLELKGPTGSAHHNIVVLDALDANTQYAWPLGAPTELGQAITVVEIDGNLITWEWATPLPDRTGHAGDVLRATADDVVWSDVQINIPPIFVSGEPTDGKLVWSQTITEAGTCADDFAGSYFKAKTGSVGNVHFDVFKNGSDVGDAVFNISATGSGLTAGGSLGLAVGDVFDVYAPATADADLADISLVFVCPRD